MSTFRTVFGRGAFGVCALLASLAACSSGGSQLPNAAALRSQADRVARPACPQVIGKPTCLALIQTKGVQPDCSGSQCGWAPIDFQTRYKLPISKGSGEIVAVVDAGDNPNAGSDLATYRTEFGLGTTTFDKYNQNGQQSNYPTYTDWSLEIDLDIEMVSATCPKCTIYLVEANSGAGSDLSAAEKTAEALGAHVINNSWICYGSSSCGLTGFNKPGITYVAAAGDAGSDEVGVPSAFDRVAAIGGTQLSKNGSKYSESIWSGGGGCATGFKKPAWQSIIPDSVCAYRLTNDAAAEAGCSPGVAEYDSYDAGGWFGVCGTSVAAPLVAGAFGLSGNATKQDGGRTFWRKTHRNDLYKLEGECNYRQGRYTTCTGWGSPDGIGAF